jgi:phospholipid/cholesterol/gamma-HCH transport system substrate-binding protein
MRRFRVVLALALVAALSASCSWASSKDDTALVADFHDVGDLVDGATVQVADVEIGSVTDIELASVDGEMVARVTMKVEPNTRIPADGLTAVIRQTSLLGEQFVQLVPTSEGGPYVGEGPVKIPVASTDRRVDVETFLGDLSAFIGGGGLEDLNQFTHAQALILENRGAKFGHVIDELETFTGSLAGRRHDLESAIDSLASASGTIVRNQETLDDFLDSLDDANVLLADQGDEMRVLFRALNRFGRVNARFLAKHEGAIDRQFRALRPIFSGLAGAQGELRRDIDGLRMFFDLFPQSLGGGPGGNGKGDYVQAEAVLCEVLSNCHTSGEKGDVPGQGS